MINRRGFVVLFAMSLCTAAVFFSAKGARFSVTADTLIASMDAKR